MKHILEHEKVTLNINLLIEVMDKAIKHTRHRMYDNEGKITDCLMEAKRVKGKEEIFKTNFSATSFARDMAECAQDFANQLEARAVLIECLSREVVDIDRQS